MAPRKIYIKGDITSVCTWLKKRHEELDLLKANVQVNRAGMTIKLAIDEAYEFGPVIEGTLSLHPVISSFGINSGAYKTPFAMSEFIKMNRVYFENRTMAMSLVSELKSFRAKVDKEIEKQDNNRGDKKLLIDQVVKTNVPEKFTLLIPIFKGGKPQPIEVEVYFNADDLTCCLVSPQLNEVIHDVSEALIEEQVQIIDSTYPAIPIIEV